MQNKDVERYSKLHKKYVAKVSPLFSTSVGKMVLSGISRGETKLLKVERIEDSNYDVTWIKNIEDCIYELGEIVKNPRRTTATVTNVVPIELARKTNAESVRHLASHTQFIKEVKENGDVIPSKILNIGSDDFYKTYENRFIATVIRRLVLFIQKRYDYVLEFENIHNAEVMYFKNKSTIEGKDVEIETKIKFIDTAESDSNIESKDYINRIKEIRTYILFYYRSDFMKMFKTERDVKNPILMTNIIRKNPLYNKCYRLYKFLESYDKLGISYKINEKNIDFTEEEIKELNLTIAANFLAMKGKANDKVYKENKKEYKPKLLTSIDDEQFVYGSYLTGPVEFVRVDKGYIDYLNSKNILPDNLSELEKKYYEEELKAKEEIEAKIQAEQELYARKQKEQEEFEIKAAKIAAQRERDLNLYRLEQERLEALERERQLEEARRRLALSALGENADESPDQFVEAKDESIVVAQEATDVQSDYVEPIEEAIDEFKEDVANDQPLVIEEPEEKIEEQPVVIEQVVDEPKQVEILEPVKSKEEIRAEQLEDARARRDARKIEEELRKQELAILKANQKAQAEIDNKNRLEEKAKLKAEKDAQNKALKAEKLSIKEQKKAEKAELKAQKLAEKEAAKAKRLEELASIKAEQEAKKAEALKLKEAEEAEKRKLLEEQRAKEKAERDARLAEELKAKEAQAAEEKRLAEERKAQAIAEKERLAKEKADAKAEEIARREAEKQAKIDAIEKAKAEEQARIKAEEEARLAKEAEARRLEEERLKAIEAAKPKPVINSRVLKSKKTTRKKMRR